MDEGSFKKRKMKTSGKQQADIPATVHDWNKAICLGTFSFFTLPRVGEWLDGDLFGEDSIKVNYRVISVEYTTELPNLWVVRQSSKQQRAITERLALPGA